MASAPSSEIELRIDEALKADSSGSTLLEPPLGPILVVAYANDKPLWLRCKKVMRSHGVPLRDIELAIKKMAHAAERIPQIGEVEHDDRDHIRSQWPDCPSAVTDNCCVPQNYRIEPVTRKPAIAREKRKIVDNQPEITFEHVSINPILITRRIAMVSSKQWNVELAHCTSGKWKTVIVPQSVAFNHRRFLDVLLDRGIMATAQHAPEICAWLLAYWDENQAEIPEMYGASELGWHGANAKFGFLLGKEQIAAPGAREVEFHSESADDEVSEYKRTGTMEGWLELCRKVQDYPAMRIAVYASLGAPLVHVLGIGNCLVDFACTTSKGKSTALRLAESCWRSYQEALPNWDTTLAAVEDRARRLSDLPLIIDETQLLDPSMASRFVYGIVGGRTRGRSHRTGDEKAAKSWRTVLMTSGEQPVSEHAHRAGAAARSLSILQPPLGPPTEAAAALADKIREGCAKHSGHAGASVVRWLVDHRSEWDNLRDAHRDRAAQLRDGTNGAKNRMADVIAMLEISAMVVHKAIPNFPWPSTPIADDPLCRPLLEEAVTHAAEASDDGTRAFEWILSIAAANTGRWWVEGQKGPSPPQGWLGKHDHDGALYCWYPAALRTELERGRFPPDAILRSWRERGWMKTEAGRSGYTTKVSIAGSSERLTCLRKFALDHGGRNHQPPVQVELPEDQWEHGD